ncbi:ABC transporter ATP-binding protein [Spirulina sp. 06S082]|uniref:ABC transporter ATP-binding protein n=1 Tax=Spirulina sp. 06S082 TaxID=3110248 RepID=UPI002B21D850|nr:ABC transporter ATP-binding protein [Spirulina sp. 06S082]MEA5467374.1 ABC transporter ATP-binding protein [Spirulina sp. 06S082]
MSQFAIKIENLGKKYIIGHQQQDSHLLRYAIANQIKNWKRQLFTGKDKNRNLDEFWALKDISFQVKQGDRVGIIGRNGAGKSTLLKLLSRITEPTTGRIRLRGRVASLLEVGTGFHPELTGRENIYLNGSILGMGKTEISKKFDEIVAFAEIERFLDTPVKRYSSGMYVRLAFAVAAHLEPEILVVDEVLAVGDAAFQKKCLGKMEDVSEREGRTVLFVSHNMAAIQQLTHQAFVLQEGQLIFSGATDRAIDYYLSGAMNRSLVVYNMENVSRRHSELDREIEFLTLELENYPNKLVPADADLHLKIAVRANKQLESFRFSMTIFRIDGSPVGSMFAPEFPSIPKGSSAFFRIILQDIHLAPGMYYFDIATGKGNHREGHIDFDIINDVLHFEVMPPEGIDGTQAGWYSGWGSIRFPEPQIMKIE